MIPISMTLVAMIVAQCLSLAALWLRLHFHMRQEDLRRRDLIEIVRAMPGNGQIQLRRADGTSVVLVVTAARPLEGSHE